MKNRILKVLNSNFFLSISVHLLLVLACCFSFLFVSATTIELPPPIEVSFIGFNSEPEPKTENLDTKPEEKKINKKEELPDILTPSIKPKVNKIRKKISKTPKVENNKKQEQSSNESPNPSIDTPKNISSLPSKMDNQNAGIEYEKVLLALLSKAKRYPERARRRGLEGNGEIYLSLNKNGDIKQVSVKNSTGNSILDRELINMVHRASPLPPLPTNYSRTEFIIPVSFSFKN